MTIPATPRLSMGSQMEKGINDPPLIFCISNLKRNGRTMRQTYHRRTSAQKVRLEKSR